MSIVTCSVYPPCVSVCRVNATVKASSEARRCSTETAVELTTVLYERHVPNYPQATLVTLCVLLGCMIVATVLGNVFVITAIVVERSLQGVSNYLVLSLAVTDLLVAVLVMPLSLLNEVRLGGCGVGGQVYWECCRGGDEMCWGYCRDVEVGMGCVEGTVEMFRWGWDV